MQYNPNLREKFNSGAKQESNKQAAKDDKATTKEIDEVFSAVSGQEISEVEVSLIQSIQILEEEVEDPTKDNEASEGETKET